MAQVATKGIYECDGHSQEGHELAEAHPVILVGKQSLIDNQGIAIVVPLTSTRPNYPVHWAVEIGDTNSSAHLRHIKSVHITKIGARLGTAETEELSGWIADILDDISDDVMIQRVRGQVLELCKKFPVYG